MADNQKKEQAKRDPLIISRSELEALSPAERQAFRDKGGTVIEDAALAALLSQ